MAEHGNLRAALQWNAPASVQWNPLWELGLAIG